MDLLYLHILTNAILKEYFANSRCVLVLSDNNISDFRVKIPVINVLVSNSTVDNNVVFKNYGCQGIIINVKTPVATLTNLEFGIRHSLERFNYRRYLVVPQQNGIGNVMDVFNTKATDFISDIIIIQLNYKDEVSFWFLNKIMSYKLYSHKYVGINTSSEVILLDEWWSNGTGFLFGNNLYPDKLTNGYGRTMKIATFTYKPYSMPVFNEGTELQLAFEFCKHRNLTPFLVVDEKGEWGDVFENWSGFGVIGNLASDSADVGLAALFPWEKYYFYLDFTQVLLRIGITCLVPSPRLADGLLLPIVPFGPNMWLAVGISFILCALTLLITDICVLKISQSNRIDNIKIKFVAIILDALHKTISIFLLQSVSIYGQLRDHFNKLFFACMFIFSLLIASTYSSGLSSSMTVPRYVDKIETVDDLVKSGIHWGAPSTAWYRSIENATEQKYVNLVERFVLTDADWLSKKFELRFALGIERMYSYYFGFGDHITEEHVSHLRILKEDIYWDYCILMTRKSSIWTPAFDDFILRMAQTGIPSYWEYMLVTSHLSRQIQFAIKYPSDSTTDDEGPIKLHWEHVEGAFALWIVGVVASSFTFILEIATNKKCITRSFADVRE